MPKPPMIVKANILIESSGSTLMEVNGNVAWVNNNLFRKIVGQGISIREWAFKQHFKSDKDGHLKHSNKRTY